MMINQPPRAYLIEGILPTDCLAMLVGAAGVGKSFVALDWAYCVAGGRPWQRLRTHKSPVVYIVGEGKSGIGKRCHAWRIAHDVPQGVAVGIRFWDPAVQFATISGRHVFRAELDEAARQLGAVPQLIIVDTLASCNVGKDENSVQDMTEFIEGLKFIRPPGATILVLHHEGRVRGRERGSTALPGAVDASLILRKHADVANGMVLSCPKLRDDGGFDPISLQRVVVKLPTGDTSCVVEELIEATAPFSAKWTAAVAALGAFPEGVTNGEWLAATGLPESSFYRLKKEAVARGMVTVRDDGKIVLVDTKESED